jgi:hypothetical protein
MMWRALVLALAVWPAMAQTITTSPRPVPRPDVTAPIAPTVPRPKARPLDLGVQAPVALADAVQPKARPSKKKSLKGAVCGNRAIRGEALAAITSRTKGCGIADPVRVTEIDGVRLSPAATINCDTAQALEKWIDQAMRPAFGTKKVVQLHIAATYACRGRNNVKGARISEHGRGNAIDIAGFTFENGKTQRVAGGFDKTMRRAHKGACGIFGTTLGPGSDGYHEDHLHFDVARHRSGSYCR